MMNKFNESHLSRSFDVLVRNSYGIPNELTCAEGVVKLTFDVCRLVVHLNDLFN